MKFASKVIATVLEFAGSIQINNTSSGNIANFQQDGSTKSSIDSTGKYTGTIDWSNVNSKAAFNAASNGLVPAPITPSGKFLKDDGTWAEVSGAGGGGGPAIVSVKRESFIATASQTVFDLVEGSYHIGSEAVSVFLLGTKQPDSAFLETSPTQITLKAGLDAGTPVIIEYFENAGELSLMADTLTIIDVQNHFTGTTVEEALNELFQSASNGKSLIATAITGKGVSANSSDSFSELASKINTITTGAPLSRITKLNVTAPYTKVISLPGLSSIDDICLSVLEYIKSNGVVKYSLAFDNSDASNFVYNNKCVTFDGTVHLNTSFKHEFVASNDIPGETVFETIIDKSALKKVVEAKEEFVNLKNYLSLTAIPKDQVIAANGDINITDVESINSLVITNTVSGNGKVLMAISVDGGTTYKAWNGSSWITVNTSDTTDFYTKGMTKSIVNALTKENLSTLRGSSNSIRMSYFLSIESISDTAANDDIKMNVDMLGNNIPCATSKYTISYDAQTKNASIVFSSNGTYTINYIV